MPQVIHMKMNPGSSRIILLVLSDPVTSERPPETKIERVDRGSPQLRADSSRFTPDHAESKTMILRRGTLSGDDQPDCDDCIPVRFHVVSISYVMLSLSRHTARHASGPEPLALSVSQSPRSALTSLQ